jgi:uncharacterized membrane protein
MTNVTPVPITKQQPDMSWREQLTCWVFLSCAVLFVVGIAEIFIWHWTGHHDESLHGLSPYLGGAGAMLVSATVAVIWTMVVFWFCLYRFLWHLGRNAVKPCPTPQEIELEMRARGYNPSLQDVMAVHTAKKREQYENIGLAAGAFLILRHFGHGGL